MHKRAERSLDEKAEVGGAERECQPLRQRMPVLVRQQRERIGIELAALEGLEEDDAGALDRIDKDGVALLWVKVNVGWAHVEARDRHVRVRWLLHQLDREATALLAPRRERDRLAVEVLARSEVDQPAGAADELAEGLLVELVERRRERIGNGDVASGQASGAQAQEGSKGGRQEADCVGSEGIEWRVRDIDNALVWTATGRRAAVSTRQSRHKACELAPELAPGLPVTVSRSIFIHVSSSSPGCVRRKEPNLN
jgi:hypothetical protein